MTLKEIRELLVLKEWTRGDLAEQLGIKSNTIDKWFIADPDQLRRPSPEHVKKMRVWLTEAREANRTQPA